MGRVRLEPGDVVCAPSSLGGVLRSAERSEEVAGEGGALLCTRGLCSWVVTRAANCILVRK